MADIKIACILRAGIYSPNRIGNDAAILNLVAEQLRKRGCVVTVYNEEQLCGGEVKEDIIVNMCREPRSIRLLQQMQDRGSLVINSGYGIENCIRERMSRILLGNGIPQPESLTVKTDEAVRDKLQAIRLTRCWVKRGDSHTMHREDVSYVRTPDEAQELLQEYFLRGIKRAVITRHLEGELVKFYGVRGSQFFYWFYPFEDGVRRYGAEAVHGRSKEPDIKGNRLRELCQRAADALEVDVYGGDCIEDHQGNLWLIDFDDWPSFAPCRSEAASQIARYIMARIKNYLTKVNETTIKGR